MPTIAGIYTDAFEADKIARPSKAQAVMAEGKIVA